MQPQPEVDSHAQHDPGRGDRGDGLVEGPVADLRKLDEAEVDPVVVDQLDGVERGDGREPKQVGALFPLIFLPSADDVPGAVMAPGSGGASGGIGTDAVLMMMTSPAFPGDGGTFNLPVDDYRRCQGPTRSLRS